MHGYIDTRINLAEYGQPDKPRKIARCEAVEEVANLIQPYNLWLLEIQFGQKNETNMTLLGRVESLLAYTKPDDEFHQALEKKAMEGPDSARGAFFILYQHDLLDKPMIALMRKYVEGQKNPEDKKSWAMFAAELGVSDYAIPYCEQLLSQPFKPDGLINGQGYFVENQLTWDYKTASDTLGYIGTNAVRLLPLLKKRQEEVQAAKSIDPAKPMILARFYTAIKCLEGTRPAGPDAAIKSPYCMWCK